MRCDTCEFWSPKPSEEWEAEEAGFRRCLAIKQRRHIEDDPKIMQTAHHDLYKKSLAAAIQVARAYVQDASDFRAELLTGPDFGCVLWAVKTGTT